MKHKRLSLKTDTVRLLSAAELDRARGGEDDTQISGERCSIVYWCEGNTSKQRSCSSC